MPYGDARFKYGAMTRLANLMLTALFESRLSTNLTEPRAVSSAHKDEATSLMR